MEMINSAVKFMFARYELDSVSFIIVSDK